MKNRIYFLLIIIAAAFFLLNTCEFSLYGLAGVTVTDTDKFSMPAVPSLFFVTGNELCAAPLPGLSADPALSVKTVFAADELAGTDELYVHKNTDSVYWTNDSRIYRYNITSEELSTEVFKAGAVNIFTIDDAGSSLAYMEDGSLDIIYFHNLVTGADTGSLALDIELNQQPWDMAYDPAEQLFVYIYHDGTNICVQTTDASNGNPITITSSPSLHIEMAIDKASNYVFWVDFQFGLDLFVAFYDSGMPVDDNTLIVSLNDMAADETNDKIYLTSTDFGNDIYRINYDVTNLETCLDNADSYISALFVYDPALQ